MDSNLQTARLSADHPRRTSAVSVASVRRRRTLVARCRKLSALAAHLWRAFHLLTENEAPLSALSCADTLAWTRVF